MSYEVEFLYALLLTSVLEITLVVILVLYFFKKEVNLLKLFFIAFIASALTLPYLWFVIPAFISRTYYVLGGEFIVFFIELILYKTLLDLKWYEAFILSFLANSFSYFIGVLF